jgi:hypothetical protein
MKRFLHLVAASVVVLLAGATVRADVIPWTYSWQRNPISIAADGTGTGGVSLTSEALPKQAAGNSDIVATNLRIFSSATAANPDKLQTNGAFALALTLLDNNSNVSGTLTFSGKLSGTFSAGNSLLTAVFSTPTTKSITLGQDTYTVTIGPYSPPGPPSASNAGSIAAHVDVTGVSGGGGGGGPGPGPGVNDVPEPSSVLLSCMGLTFLGGAAGRKRLVALLRK